MVLQLIPERRAMDDIPTRIAGLAENTAEKQQRGRPFEPGQSGNPQGRPKGSRNKATLAAESLLEGESEVLIRTLVEKAKEGDSTALRLCIDRVLPLRRDRAVTFDLPEIKTAADAVIASNAVLGACSAGALSPDEAMKIMSMIEAHVRTLEIVAIEVDLSAVEEIVKAR
jgi:hypothetical protein